MSSLKEKKLELKSLLAKYKLQIDDFIQKEFSINANENKLKEAALYALEGSGKRFRPCITLIVAELLGNDLEALYAALAIELFHTASLIADDLPSMDNDEIRRNRLSLHKVFGEDVTLLTSFALIGEGYQCIFKNKKVLKGKLCDLDQRAFMALSLLAQNNGFEGAPSGQYLDLHPFNLNQEKLDLILYRKTVLFFETAFALGWLFGGGDLSLFPTVNKASYHFGMAFQIYDDFCDFNQDNEKMKKVNYPITLGVDKSQKALAMHLKNCKENLEKLGLYQMQFKELLNFLSISSKSGF